MSAYLADLASDFSVLHRVDDIGAMPSGTFLAFAGRLPAYEGVMRARVAEELEDEAPAAPPSLPGAGAPVNMVGASQVELRSEPAFAGVFSFGKAQ